MSDSNDAPNLELSDEGDDIQKQRWFFTLLSDSQAETILNEGSSGKQTRSSRFLVSNLPSSKDYRISIRRTGQAVKNSKATNYVEHITISYNEEDQSYGIEGEKRYQSVVEVVREYVASRDYVMEPFSGSLEETSTEASGKSLLMSIKSIESTQIEEPPAYNTAIQYPTDKRPLPQIKTKLDPNKAQEATLQRSLRMTAYAAVDALTDYEWDDDQSCYHWCMHPCHPGREFYSISRAGCLRQLCFLLILFFVILVCGWQCGCCAVVLACCCELLNDDID